MVGLVRFMLEAAVTTLVCAALQVQRSQAQRILEIREKEREAREKVVVLGFVAPGTGATELCTYKRM